MLRDGITVGEKTVIRSLGLAGVQGGGAPCAVDVRDGKVIRVRPLHYDWRYDKKDLIVAK
ncbi:MAG: hypothetical protein MUO40_01170 [Anaerolineaceae bacterium]|nr:hypothetical protein [Anaerolineaceae bacterium]